MPFGLMNSGCTFQRVIHEVLRDLPYLFIYIDDILVGSRSLEEHEQHLSEVFTRIRENCLTVNLKKCVLAKSTVYIFYDPLKISKRPSLVNRDKNLSQFQTLFSVQNRPFFGRPTSLDHFI